MVRLFSWLTGVAIAMVLVAGIGAYWLSRADVAQAQQEKAAAIAKGAALGVSASIGLLNNTLDKMAQDPEVLTAVTVGNQAMLDMTAAKLEKFLPGVMKIRLLLPEVSEPDVKNFPPMGFADLDMVRETLTSNQSPGIQGDKADRHLAIARRITQNGQAIGVILASMNYEFIDKHLAAAAVADGYMDIMQGRALLAAVGNRINAEQNETDRINVANTDWVVNYQYAESTTGINFGAIAIIVMSALAGLLACVVAYRHLSEMLSRDLNNLMKAFKDMMTHNLQGNYPFQLSEMGALFSNLMQFKRVLDNNDHGASISDKDDLNITVSDDDDFDLDIFFDDPTGGLNPR